MIAVFADRFDAGRQLGERLRDLAAEHPVVVGLPRGGVPVASEVARRLGAELDVIVVRKLGVPFQPELGMGAIGEDGVRIVNNEVVRLAGVTEDEIAAVEQRERAELVRRAERFRRGRERISLSGRTVIVVDDGIATGSTARAACRVAREHGATRIVLAVPVAPRDWIARIGAEADECICLATPEPFFAVGQFYENFTQTTDDEVAALLGATAVAGAPAAADPPVFDEDVDIQAGPVVLSGHLTVPEQVGGLVVFAHGSGSSRHSPRNRYVAEVLNEAQLGTLLFDLLTPIEETDRSNVFDIELLARRLVDATAWLARRPEATGVRIGYFGASTGAAAALWAAAEPGADIGAVVSRGGRPDLAGRQQLRDVRAPTLLIVGGWDEVVLELNRQAQAELRCTNRLEIAPGATHLFEEPGTLQAAAELARDWFVQHLTGRRPDSA